MASAHSASSNACKPPSFPFPPTHGSPRRLGAAILSHHVDTFSLVSAFFLFSLGCLNILVGLIWREKAKAKRSLLAWRDPPASVLPTHVGAPLRVDPQTDSVLGRTLSNVSGRSAEKDEDPVPSRAGLGFGRQGEKAAANRGAWACLGVCGPLLMR